MNRPRILLAAALLGLAGPAPALAHNGVVHEAPHGGIMRSVTNAHIEIVLAPQGGVRIYVYTLKSAPLPASAVSELSVEIDRPRAKTEYVAMRPDPTGTLWTGPSRPVTDPASVVRVGCVVQGASSLIEVPRAKFPTYAAPKPKVGRAH